MLLAKQKTQKQLKTPPSKKTLSRLPKSSEIRLSQTSVLDLYPCCLSIIHLKTLQVRILRRYKRNIY